MPSEPPPSPPDATHAGALRIVRNTGMSHEQLAALLAGHDQALATGEGVLQSRERTAVTRVALGEQTYCVKEYRELGLLDRVKDTLRGSRAVLAWRAAEALASRGVATPEAVAVVERGRSHFFVTRFVEDSASLKDLLRGRFAGPLSRDEIAAKRAMARQLGPWLRRVHDQCVYHDDWSLKNILARQRGEVWDFYFLDLESMPHYKWLTRRRRIKNLGQLNDTPAGVTHTDRMRFLLAYAGDDRELTRGRFPLEVLAATRLREHTYHRTQGRILKRRARQKHRQERRRSRHPS